MHHLSGSCATQDHARMKLHTANHKTPKAKQFGDRPKGGTRSGAKQLGDKHKGETGSKASSVTARKERPEIKLGDRRKEDTGHGKRQKGEAHKTFPNTEGEMYTD